MAYTWDVEKYIEEAENGSDPGLQEYQQRELEFITRATDDFQPGVVIDVGAGYGRVLPPLMEHTDTLIAVEQDPNELIELQKRANQYPGASVINGSGNNLSELLPETLPNPLLLSLQNTLGPWDGSRDEAIDQLKAMGTRNAGSVIISLFCREAMEDWGIPMYATLQGLLGNYDAANSDIASGLFKTDTGYESHWFSKNEREAMKQQLDGKLVAEVEDHKFHLFQIIYE